MAKARFSGRNLATVKVGLRDKSKFEAVWSPDKKSVEVTGKKDDIEELQQSVARYKHPIKFKWLKEEESMKALIERLGNKVGDPDAVIVVRRDHPSGKSIKFKWSIDETKGASKKIGVKSGMSPSPEGAFSKAYRVAKKQYGWE